MINKIDLESRNLLEVEVLEPVLGEGVVEVEGKRELNIRDEIRDEVKEGIRYLKKETFWIHSNDKSKRVVSPKDKDILLRYLHEESGVLNGVLKRLNWHISCKKELLRWIKKHGLQDELMVAREDLIDQSEGVIKDALGLGDIKAAQFVLKTAGKKRGWSEHEKGEGDVKNVYGFVDDMVGVDIKSMSDDELVRYIEEGIRGKS